MNYQLTGTSLKRYRQEFGKACSDGVNDLIRSLDWRKATDEERLGLISKAYAKGRLAAKAEIMAIYSRQIKRRHRPEETVSIY